MASDLLALREPASRETRDAANKSIAHFKQWHTLVTSDLFKQYGHKEVEIETAAPENRTQFSAVNIFQPVHASDGTGDSLPLRDILQQKSWTSFTAQSVKNTCSQSKTKPKVERSPKTKNITENESQG